MTAQGADLQQLPDHGEDLPILEVIGVNETREVMKDSQGDLVPVGSGITQLVVRFPGGNPFALIVANGADFDNIIQPAMERALANIYKRKMTPTITELAIKYIDNISPENPESIKVFEKLQEACVAVGLNAHFLLEVLKK